MIRNVLLSDAGGSLIHTSSSGATHGGLGGSLDSNYYGGFGNIKKSDLSTDNGASFNGVSYGSPYSASSVSSGGSDWSDIFKQISDYNNAFNLQQVENVNAFNAQEAQKNRDWQERLSNTAHQREVKDLIKAGLNPVLSAGGQGAITGSGAVASGQKAVADTVFGNGMMNLMQSMISAASAQNVAKIYASASMYGADRSYASQENYQKVWKEISDNTRFDRLISDAFKGLSNMASAIK